MHYALASATPSALRMKKQAALKPPLRSILQRTDLNKRAACETIVQSRRSRCTEYENRWPGTHPTDWERWCTSAVNLDKQRKTIAETNVGAALGRSAGLKHRPCEKRTQPSTLQRAVMTRTATDRTASLTSPQTATFGSWEVASRTSWASETGCSDPGKRAWAGNPEERTCA